MHQVWQQSLTADVGWLCGAHVTETWANLANMVIAPDWHKSQYHANAFIIKRDMWWRGPRCYFVIRLKLINCALHAVGVVFRYIFIGDVDTKIKIRCNVCFISAAQITLNCLSTLPFISPQTWHLLFLMLKYYGKVRYLSFTSSVNFDI